MDDTAFQDSAEDFSYHARNFFKFSTFIILLILVGAQLIELVFKITVIPDVISIIVAFTCVLYLWLAERKDIEVLQIINRDLLRAREELKASHVDTILSLVLTQEAKDSYTYGHSERVKRYAIMLAQRLGLLEEEIGVVSRGAKLHDIGKIGIRDEVLFEVEKLTEEQFDLIKSHTIKGVAILEPLKFLNEEKKIVRHHHEYYNGTGYPDKLKGEDIPLGARIVCVADTFDAMRSKRLYRDPLSKEAIIRQFQANAGTQFDPKIVDVFIKNIDHFYA